VIKRGRIYMEGKAMGNFGRNSFGRRSKFVKKERSSVIFLLRRRILVTERKHLDMRVFNQAIISS